MDTRRCYLDTQMILSRDPRYNSSDFNTNYCEKTEHNKGIPAPVVRCVREWSDDNPTQGGKPLGQVIDRCYANPHNRGN